MAKVMLGGLVTTLLTLAVVWTVERQGITVMGWYLNYVIPVGGIVVGLAASSGYGIASWSFGVKISGRLLAAVFALQVAAYFAASWIQFAAYSPVYPDGSPVSFATFFDATTRAFSFVQKDGSSGTPYGVWGYLFRALEVAGFSFGSLIAPAMLKGRPYCDSCSLYMRAAKSLMLAASLPSAKLGKDDLEGVARQQAEQRDAYEKAIEAVDELHGFAEANDAPGFRERAKELEVAAKAASKLPQRIAMALTHCPRCESGELRSTLWSGQGQHQQGRELGRSPLAQFFARNAAS